MTLAERIGPANVAYYEFLDSHECDNAKRDRLYAAAVEEFKASPYCPTDADLQRAQRELDAWEEAQGRNYTRRDIW